MKTVKVETVPGKSNLVSSEKVTYVWEALAGAFIFGKLRLLRFWDMPLLKKLPFCPFLVKVGSRFDLDSRIGDIPITSDGDGGGSFPTSLPIW